MKTERKNIHISYDQSIKPYHKVIAGLTFKYLKNNGSVLDIGCGVGHILAEIHSRNSSLCLTGVDIDEDCLDITTQRVNLKRSLRVSKVEDLFDIKGVFDVVIMSHVLEHTYRPFDIIQGVMEMLTPQGVAIFAVPNPVRLHVVLGNIVQKHYVNRGHVYAWDRSHWKNFLENILHLDVVCYASDFFPLPIVGKIRMFQPIECWLAKIFPWFSFSNIAVVRNP